MIAGTVCGIVFLVILIGITIGNWRYGDGK